MTAISLPPQCCVRERRKTVITSGHPRGSPWPDVITVFLRSLTQHWGGKLIAVIVSGYDGDASRAQNTIIEDRGAKPGQEAPRHGRPGPIPARHNRSARYSRWVFYHDS